MAGPSTYKLQAIIFLVRRVITAGSSPISNVIIKPPVRLIVQGHAHGVGLVWNDYGACSGETGCMCEVGDYASDPKLRTPRPWCLAMW